MELASHPGEELRDVGCVGHDVGTPWSQQLNSHKLVQKLLKQKLLDTAGNTLKYKTKLQAQLLSTGNRPINSKYSICNIDDTSLMSQKCLKLCP